MSRCSPKFDSSFRVKEGRRLKMVPIETLSPYSYSTSVPTHYRPVLYNFDTRHISYRQRAGKVHCRSNSRSYGISSNKKPTNWLGQAKCHNTKIRPKAVRGGIFGRFFSNSDKCRPEVAGDVISGVVVDQAGKDFLVKFRDSRSICSWDIWATHSVIDEWRQTQVMT